MASRGAITAALRGLPRWARVGRRCHNQAAGLEVEQVQRALVGNRLPLVLAGLPCWSPVLVLVMQCRPRAGRRFRGVQLRGAVGRSGEALDADMAGRKSVARRMLTCLPGCTGIP